MELQSSQAVGAAAPETAAPGTSLSVFQRAVAVFVRPGSAWGGLETRVQWWFPLIVMIVFSAAFSALLHDRALMPMITESWEQAVADGRMTGEQVDRMTAFMSGPAGMAITIGQQAIAVPILFMLAALIVWFGVGFVLGKKFRFRLALECAAWSSLITIPGQFLTGALAWSKQTMKGLHTGLGVLVPESDPVTKLQTGLAFFLDAIGPLSIWYLAVLIIGASALSGAPRKSTAWVLGGLYLALMVGFAVLAGMMSRGG
ncbi:MAG TPA: YIP1 family protein [Candidatus Eisenbacteria bacterium]|nr:YIP1 family protein [Candidatus Eisenbacteria bacterium]